MNEFLSEENIASHREYLRTQRLKYSILEDSIPPLRKLGVKEVYRSKLSTVDKRDALLLLSDILLHDVYFSSFCDTRFPHSDAAIKSFGAESSLLNDLFRLGMSMRCGFACVCQTNGSISVHDIEDCHDILRYGEPILAVDVFEHAYFMDYGFDKERYLLSALPYLDLTKLTVADA